MKNLIIYNEIICPRCGSNELKQIPAKWDEFIVYEFYPNHYFCIHCGLHHYKAVEEKEYA